MITIALRIQWHAPEETTVTQVEINKSTTIYGTYTVLATIDATSDGAVKSSANTWVTTYTDTGGGRNNWYKIRFYDSVTAIWSEYSEPITAEELFRLCSVSDIKNTINTVGRWTDDEIFDAITEIDENIYIEMGTPLQSVLTATTKIDDTIQNRYYVGEENIYRVDRVFYGTASKNEIFLDDGYKVNNKFGMIEVLPVASSGVTLDETQELEIQFVPSLYHKYSLYSTCQFLLEQVDTTSGGKTSKELQVINAKLDNVNRLLMHRIGLQTSSMVRNYNSLYGVNQKTLVQDPYKNKFIGGSTSINW